MITPWRRTALRPALAVTVAALAGAVAFTHTASHHNGAARAALSPVVRHTGKPPTGYEVTFRYRDPTAAIVDVTGEWYYSEPGHTTASSSQGLLPAKWKPGDLQIGWPNVASSAGWPVARMKKGPHGVWSFTTPLTSGVFEYGFFVDCPSVEHENPNTTSCVAVSDPGNPPWNQHGVSSIGSIEQKSHVYVPSDPAFHTVDYSWEAPTSPKGALSDVTYPSPLSESVATATGVSNPAGKNYLAVYTPPGYNAHRSKAYPTLYLSHGWSGNEVDWSIGGDAANILDNLIDKHTIEPMVVVMTNFAWLGAAGDDITFDKNLIKSIVPFVQSHYHVSRVPSRRAFAGLSYGGYMAGSLLANYVKEFGYYGLFSPAPVPLPALSASQAAGLRHVGVMVGGGNHDPIDVVAADLSALRQAHVKAVVDLMDGGHDWYIWRVLLRDFLTRVAFKSPKG
jgi:enterochelin esterase-like enzyme